MEELVPSYGAWQVSSPLFMHVYMYCLVHTTYDVSMTVAWELLSRYAGWLRVDEITFAAWNIVVFLLNFSCTVFAWYLWYNDFPPDFVGVHTWTTLFFAMFIVDGLYIAKNRMYFKQKILKFLTVHHILTFFICIVYSVCFTAPALLNPLPLYSMMPPLWNGSSTITNMLWLFRLFRGKARIDTTLLVASIVAFVAQRAWRTLGLCFFFSHREIPYSAAFVIVLPGLLMDFTDGMSQWSAILLIKRTIAENHERQHTSLLLQRKVRDEPAVDPHQHDK